MNRFGVLAGRASRRRPLVLVAVLAMMAPLGIIFSAQAQATPAGSPIGNFDSAIGVAGGAVRVAGWAFDPDDRRVATDIHVYIDGVAGSSARGVNIGPANLARTDVGAAHPTAGPNHGFNATITGLTPGRHMLYVYALNTVGVGSNTLMVSRSVTVPGSSVIGTVDSAQGAAGGFIRVGGWMFDTDVPTRSGTVHVYIDGPAGSGARMVPIGASLSRVDVAAAYPTCGPNHGFNATITNVAPGGHTLYFYGLNVGGPGGSVYLGHKTATVPAMTGSILPSSGVLHPGGSLTSTDGRYRLTMQGDGNLVEMVAATGRVLWHSRTFGNAGARLVMQGDGNAVIYNKAGQAPWSTGTAGTGNGSRLVLQTDANLVNYNSGWRAVWASYTKI